jgi:hypothetical protein
MKKFFTGVVGLFLMSFLITMCSQKKHYTAHQSLKQTSQPTQK